MNIASITPLPSLETAGKWFPFEDAEVLIAPNQNPAHREALAKLAKTKYRRALRKSDTTALEQMTCEAMVDTVLLNWKGLTETKDSKEVEIPFTRENALRLLKIVAFREFVSEEAANLSNFTAQEDEALKGDLKRISAMEPGVVQG